MDAKNFEKLSEIYDHVIETYDEDEYNRLCEWGYKSVRNEGILIGAAATVGVIGVIYAVKTIYRKIKESQKEKNDEE